MNSSNSINRFLALFAVFGTVATAQQSFFDAIGGRFERTPNSNLANYGNYNTEKCFKNTEGQACEDVKIHEPSSTAFLACGDPEQRQTGWFPPVSAYDRSSEQPLIEYFLKYDIERNVTTRLRIENWNQDNDLVLHGLDFWQPGDNATEIQIFAVNHDRQGEKIALFSHTLGSDTLRFIKQFSDPTIKTPNQVTAAGPRSFFITNDHYFFNGTFREFEEEQGPFSWATDVVYCAEENDQLNCRSVSPPNAHPGLNGIILVDGGKTLMANDADWQDITAYDVDTASGNLTEKFKIVVGAIPDNLSVDRATGDLYVATIPDLLVNDRLSSVTRLVKSRGYAPEVVLWSDGSLASLLTGVAYDSRQKMLIAGGVFEKHFIVCDFN